MKNREVSNNQGEFWWTEPEPYLDKDLKPSKVIKEPIRESQREVITEQEKNKRILGQVKELIFKGASFDGNCKQCDIPLGTCRRCEANRKTIRSIIPANTTSEYWVNKLNIPDKE